MKRLSILAVVIVSFLFCACGQETPSQSQGKPAAKPVAEAAPAPAAAPPPATVSPTPIVPATKSPEPAAVTPAEPEPAKPKNSSTADTAAPLPVVADTLILKASQGDVTLSHLAHARRYPCATCHGEATPGKFELTKESAHALCRDCHKARAAGPTACGECHKK